ncbi:hypothetical protein SNEBB_000737 [Seison nebaliae]|nr:hypothetical protein SNEBB_000737 [Seison nebaliae]
MLQSMSMLKPGAEEDKAENARTTAFVGAIAIGDLVKSTLGPKGMDKILLNASERELGKIQVTNDGATILRSIGVDNPIAKVLIDISRVQDDEVGDGTTSVTIFACELLRGAESLVAQHIHPQIIIEGWRRASKIAVDQLNSICGSYKNEDKDDLEFEKERLAQIAMTTLSSKILQHLKEFFANLAVDAILRLKGSGNLEAIHIIKKLGGNLQDSFLDDGFLLDKKVGLYQPKRMENCDILIANTPMDTDKIKVFGSRVRVDGISKLAEIEKVEKVKMREKVEKILNHKCNVFINRQLIYNYPEQLFADAKVMAIEHADFEGVERLALVTGGEIVSTFDQPDKVRLGHCDVIEEVMIGEDKLLKFSGVKLGEACTIVIRGATQQILDEAERALHDALCVLQQTVKDSNVIYGGGWAEVRLALAIKEEAKKLASKEAIAMESFANALLQLPTTIADNGGYDSAELITKLIAQHSNNKDSLFGLNMDCGDIGDMKELGILECQKVKRQMIVSAAEAAEMILRVDNIIRCAPRPRQKDNRPYSSLSLHMSTKAERKAAKLLRRKQLLEQRPETQQVKLVDGSNNGDIKDKNDVGASGKMVGELEKSLNDSTTVMEIEDNKLFFGDVEHCFIQLTFSDRCDGTLSPNHRCRLLLSALYLFIDVDRIESYSEIIKLFQLSISYYKKYVQLNSGQFNILHLYRQELDMKKKDSIKSIQTHMKEWIKQFASIRMRLPQTAISNYAIDNIKIYKTFLIFGKSSIILDIMKMMNEECLGKMKPICLYIVNADEYENENKLKELVEKSYGIDIINLSLSDVQDVLPRVDRILVEVDGITNDGSVIAPTGVAVLALEAKEQSKSIIFICETFKFTEEINERKSKNRRKNGEIISPQLTTNSCVLSEVGFLPVHTAVNTIRSKSNGQRKFDAYIHNMIFWDQDET